MDSGDGGLGSRKSGSFYAFFGGIGFPSQQEQLDSLTIIVSFFLRKMARKPLMERSINWQMFL